MAATQTVHRLGVICEPEVKVRLERLAKARRQTKGGVIADLIDAEAVRLGLVSASPAVLPPLSPPGDAVCSSPAGDPLRSPAGDVQGSDR